MEYYVYILSCADGTLYTGITTDLARRISDHNRKKGARYTASRTPVVLVYSECHDNRSEALKRELEIKGMKREDKIKLIDTQKKYAAK